MAISMYKFLRFCYKTDNLSISSGPYMYEVTLVGTVNMKGSIEDLVLIRLHWLGAYERYITHQELY